MLYILWMSEESIQEVTRKEGMVLRTGIVPTGVYADKIRKSLFAQLSQRMKAGELSNTEVVRAAAEINQLLYDALVTKLVLSKSDLVRVEAPYKIEGGKILWDYSNLKVRVFREINQEVVAKAIQEAMKSIEDLKKGAK